MLKFTGYAVIKVQTDEREVAFEDFSIIDPLERERVFGQKDHVRIYRRDYIKRLTIAGFKVTLINFTKKLE